MQIKNSRSVFIVSLAIVATFALTSSTANAAWTAPIGIPVPPFGINEGQPSGGPILTTAPTGTVNGPATYKLSGTIAYLNFTAHGTASNWVYVTSADPAHPATIGGIDATGSSYVIFDHLKIGPLGFGAYEGSDHIVLRNSEVFGSLGNGSNGSGGGVGFGSWSYNGSQTASYIVVDHNNIHDIGDLTPAGDVDSHCMAANGSVDHLWVTYNTIDRCGGDAIQIEAQDGRSAHIHHIFYGKNETNGNRQSGGWVKNASNIIFSQNVAHNFQSNSGGPGTCFGNQYDSIGIWYLFNECYSSAIGIIESSGSIHPGPTYLIGNYLHDIHAPSTNPYDSGAITMRLGTTATVFGNTITNSDSGVNVLPGQTALVSNNIFFGITGPSLYSEGTLTSDHNLFAPGVTFVGTSAGAGSIMADPKFISTTNPRLQASSPAIHAGVAVPPAVNGAFQAAFGVPFPNVDFDSHARPTGNPPNIGAFEYGGGGTTPAPTTPPGVLREGDMISASGTADPDIYIINAWGFKRLFLNPVIFSFYGHLGGFQNVKSVTPQTRDAFGTTLLIRNCESDDQKVYAIEIAGEDTAVLHHVQMTGSQAVAEDPAFFNKVFCVNNSEYAWYPQSITSYTTLDQVPPYVRR